METIHIHETKEAFIRLFWCLETKPGLTPLCHYGRERLEEIAQCWRCCWQVEEAFDTQRDFPTLEAFLANLRQLPFSLLNGDGRTTSERWTCLRFM